MPLTTTTKDDIRERLDQFELAQVIHSELLTVYEGWSIRRLTEFFVKHCIPGAPVIASEDKLVGVFTQSDTIRFESRVPSEHEVN